MNPIIIEISALKAKYLSGDETMNQIAQNSVKSLAFPFRCKVAGFTHPQNKMVFLLPNAIEMNEDFFEFTIITK